MKILIANGHLHVGGVEKSLVTLLRSIDYSRHQVDLLLFEGLGEYADQIPEEVNVILWDMTPVYGSVREALHRARTEKKPDLAWLKIVLTMGSKVSPGLLRLLKQFHKADRQYDCAIAYRVGMPLDFVGNAVDARVKCVWWHHGEFNYPRKQIEYWANGFRRMDRIVCVSRTCREMLSQHFPQLTEKICIIPSMVIPEEISEAAKAFDPYTQDRTRRVLVSVGRLSEEKHMIDTVDAMEELRRRGHEDLLWVLVGDGAQREKIEARIKALGLESCMRLVGNQANPYPYMGCADVFVHPSWVESQGLSVLEAMALGKTCVVVHSAGTDEFVRDGINAFSAEQSAESLADKVEVALTYNATDNLLPGQTETLARFSPNVVVNNLFELLTE